MAKFKYVVKDREGKTIRGIMDAASRDDAVNSFREKGLVIVSVDAEKGGGAFSLGTLLTSAKIILIVVFVFLASPTATHAIVDAGVRAGLAPWTKGEERR